MNEYIAEETLDPKDWESMRALGHRILDDALDYLETLRDRPVWRHAPPDVKAHFEGPPPFTPQPSEEVYEEYVQYILPHQLGNSHPRFWGWVAGTGTVMGMFAELLGAATDAGQRFLFLPQQQLRRDAGSRLVQVPAWLSHRAASGLLTSGCSASNLIGLAVARNAKAGFDLRSKGMQGAPQQMTIYCSEEAHSSIQKAVELLGLGSDSLHRVPVNESMQIDLAALKAAIKNDREDGFLPFCVIGVAGTTNTGAIDDLQSLAGHLQ